MKLIDLKNGKYRVVINGTVSIEGSWEFVEMHLMRELGVEESELEAALEEMHKRNHDTADFGINRMFTYTCNSLTAKHAMFELEAIQALRREFHEAMRNEPNGIEAKQAYDRLMHMYFSLNVDALLEVVGPDAVRKFVA